jgi:hypothetical protein
LSTASLVVVMSILLWVIVRGITRNYQGLEL